MTRLCPSYSRVVTSPISCRGARHTHTGRCTCPRSFAVTLLWLETGGVAVLLCSHGVGDDVSRGWEWHGLGLDHLVRVTVRLRRRVAAYVATPRDGNRNSKSATVQIVSVAVQRELLVNLLLYVTETITRVTVADCRLDSPSCSRSCPLSHSVHSDKDHKCNTDCESVIGSDVSWRPRDC